ncbi:uncharacterized protein LOC105849856 [Hydra vulgaris]|uniref:uncharacterized protein LOC105849856 n=1 Tax=Hydra vulgaris TaxID=6087 RepID=UPI0032EA32D5
MTLRKGIANQATIDEQQQKLLHKERKFWRAVLERILDIILFLSARNLAFHGSDTTIGSKSNGNFLGVFELLAKYDTVLNKLMQRIQDKDTKEHYLSNDTQNELIRLLAKEIESKNLSRESLICSLCKPFTQSCYCWSSISAISFFDVLSRLYTLFSSSPPRWEILKSCTEISVKPQSDTRWESRINCVKPLCYYLKEILEELERLEEHALEKRDEATATEVRSLTEYIRTWPFLLSINIWYDVLFQINKSSKLLQSPAVSLDILACEIKATNSFLYEYRENGFSDACIKASEIAELLGIERVFPIVRSRKKKSIYSYECVDHTRQLKHQYKADFFLLLIDMSIASVKERFEQVSIVTKLFDFFYRSESLIKACNENSLSVYCKSLQLKLNDIDFEDLEMELKRFVIVIKEEKNAFLKSAHDFLNYIYKEEL